MADVEAIRAKLAGLSPEQRAELDDILRSQLGGPGAGQGDLYRPEPSGNVFADAAIAGMEAPSASSLEEAGENLGTAAGIMTVPSMIAKPVGALVGAAKRGIGPTAGAIGDMALKGAVGAGAGALIGSLPIIGKGPWEGAKLGAAIGAGEGGVGALWQHGKRRGAIEWLMRRAGVEPRRKAASAIANEVKAATTAARVAKELSPEKQAILGASRAARAAKASEAVSAAKGTVANPKAELENLLQSTLTKPAASAGMSEAELVDMARWLRRTSHGERAALQEWLKTQPPEVAQQIRGLLKR